MFTRSWNGTFRSHSAARLLEHYDAEVAHARPPPESDFDPL